MFKDIEKILYVASKKFALPSIALKLENFPVNAPRSKNSIPYLALPSIPSVSTVSLDVDPP